MFKNPLLEAILEQDLQKVRQLSKDAEKDSLGFTPLEIAKLLDYKECVHLLEPIPKKAFKVMHEGDLTPENYSIELLQKVFGIRYLPYLRFTNYEALKQVINKCPWILRTCVGKENRLLAEKYRNKLQSGFVVPTLIKWIDKQMGYGLFADEDLPSNTYVGEYTGLVRRVLRSNPDHNPYCFQYPTQFWNAQYYVVDAFWQGNETRFLNHSVQPNLEPVCVMDRKVLHTVFITNQAIKSGTELTFNYGLDFWSSRSIG